MLIFKPLATDVMQKIADEIHVSETAFIQLLKEEDWEDSHHFSLRWMTPRIEVNLCGHATLAASHVLFNELSMN